MPTKEVDLWITQTPDDILIDSVGIANLNVEEIEALIEFLRDRLGKRVNEKMLISSS